MEAAQYHGTQKSWVPFPALSLFAAGVLSSLGHSFFIVKMREVNLTSGPFQRHCSLKDVTAVASSVPPGGKGPCGSLQPLHPRSALDRVSQGRHALAAVACTASRPRCSPQPPHPPRAALCSYFILFPLKISSDSGSFFIWLCPRCPRSREGALCRPCPEQGCDQRPGSVQWGCDGLIRGCHGAA